MRHNKNENGQSAHGDAHLEKSKSSDNMLKPFAGTLHHELRRASGALSGLMTQLFSELQLKPSEATLLMTIGRNPGCTQSDIARMHRSKPANLVPLIARLEREGLVARVSGKGRIVGLTASAQGEKVLWQVRNRFERIEESLSRQLDENAVSALVRGLQLICYNACHFERPSHDELKD
jgi:DNA-binding MarR family transcriptional regulator